MPAKLDLTLIPLHRRDGQDHPYLPGLHAAAAPRRAARGRGEDRLVLHLSVPVELNLGSDAQISLLQDMAAGYFRTPGAVTSALREQVERLNSYLLQRNQGAAPGQPPAAALLSVMMLREERLTLAQCGPVQAFQLGDSIRHYYDPQGAGRGLGLGQQAQMRFYQFDLQPGELVLSLAQLPSGWGESTLSGASQAELGALCRRLLDEAGEQLAAALLTVQPGAGALQQMTIADLQPAASVAAPMPAPQPNAEVAPSEAETSLSDTSPLAPQPVPSAWEAVEVPGESEPIQAAAPTPPAPAEVKFERETPKIDLRGQISERAAAFSERVLPPIRHFLERILPEEPIFNLPPRVMGLIALLVPIAVVILVAVVYLQFGREQLYINYLERAQAAAAIAAASGNPAEVRQAWEGVVYYAERAAHYEEDQATAFDLLAQASAALDEMDVIRRLEFMPILSQPLPRETEITRMAATNNEIYLLDGASGNVLRVFLTGDGGMGGYQLDANFRCGPGQYGGFIVSALVDLALLPRGNAAGAEIIAMDANGNVLFCAQGQAPSAQTLAPPDNHWGAPRAMRVANGNLYILDPQTNAVWLYTGEDHAFGEAPRFFFGAEVPSLRDTLDIAVYGSDIYLLGADGRMVSCTLGSSASNPTTCENPAIYTDIRPSFSNGVQLEGANFEQLRISEPPQPAVFMLDPVARAVYRLSLTLSLDTQFRSLNDLPPGLATAFAVTPNRAILLAIANDVYIGFLPSE
ncbi:MAG: hypothetical protein KIS85_01140 [Anaerolineales bacterium]|nr:hypothetical protein [Anaerolineales bacterium]